MNNYGIYLNEENHEYTVVKNKQELKVDSSITQVLKAVDLAPNYSNIDEGVLKHASEVGTKKHAQMEEYFMLNGAVDPSEYEDVLDTQNSMDEYSFNDDIKCELPIVIEYKDKVIAGTIDFIDLTKKTIVDYKFTSELHNNYVEAQMNLYAYAVRHFKGTINGLEFNNEVVDTIRANHKGKFVDFELWDDSKVEELLDCYINGLPYIDERALQTLDSVNTDLVAQEYELAHFEAQVKRFTELIAERRQNILNEMLEKGIKTYEVSGVKYTVVEESTRESFDSAKFKKENPDLYEQYKKTSKAKPSLRVKVVEQ